MKFRELVKLLEQDGWKCDRQRGSHRQFGSHPAWYCHRSGQTERGRTGRNARQYLAAGWDQGAKAVTGYAVIIERSETGYGAYVPELPGVGVVGATVEEVTQLMHEAIEFHIESLHEHGEPVPPPSAVAAALVQATAR